MSSLQHSVNDLGDVMNVLKQAEDLFAQSVELIKKMTPRDFEQVLANSGYKDLKVESIEYLEEWLDHTLLFSVKFDRTPNFNDVVGWGEADDETSLAGTITVGYDAATGKVYAYIRGGTTSEDNDDATMQKRSYVISIEYEGGMNSEIDRQLDAVSDEWNGEGIGGGCCTFAPYARDQQYEFRSLNDYTSALSQYRTLARNMKRRKHPIKMTVGKDDQDES